MVRTTVRLDPALVSRAKAEARSRGTTLTRLIEQGLELVLAGSGGTRRTKRVRLPTSRSTGGALPGVDLDDTSALLDRLDAPR
jgi:hypothetical protein